MDTTSLRAILASRRSALIDEWFARTVSTYPPETARTIATLADPFRNPVGHTLRQSLGALLDAVVLGDDPAAAARALGEVMRLRAVQTFSEDEAVAFIAPLKAIVRAGTRLEPCSIEGDGCAMPPMEQGVSPVVEIDARIDELTALAVAMYEECRGRIDDLRVNELKRRTWALTRTQDRP